MGTILKNSDWEKRITVQKGNIGESIVQQFLESKGFICYKPVSEGAHAFDFLAIKDKRLVIAAEVKTKALMNKYNATGFNKQTWYDYIMFSANHRMQIFVFFVDEHKKQVYGNWLSELEQQCEVDGITYPFDMLCRNGKIIRLYPYCKMRHIADISDTESEILKQLSTRNYEYKVG